MDKTIEYYNKNSDLFINSTKDVEFDKMQNMLIKHLKKGDCILDLGCGSGRDSKAFLEKGFKVVSVDGSKNLCEFAKNYIGQDVINSTFQDFKSNIKFDGVWACASLLHLPYEELKKVMKNISSMLKIGGYFYLSFKYGDFEGERNGRYFTDMTEEKFKELIKDMKEYKLIEKYITEDVRAL
ncbi:MAG: class I SAM-dependent methyltransferase, partial [Clostridium sp.]|nr:class I SAM-dependent methyltransferase [Clostridium sp.]